MEIFRDWKEEEQENFQKEKTKLFSEAREVVKKHNKVKTYPIDPIECNPKILDKKGDK